ncbi:MAG: hypothetical protein PHE25_02525 [Candidatus Gracilibacteria bacterium]|nr:hypothetical protein [Candidatus Gracilibacteria bacterium]
MNRETKQKYIYEIISNFVTLEKHAGNENSNIDDFKDVGELLMKLSDEELEKLYKEVMNIYLETYKKMTNTLGNIKKQILKETEKLDIENEENLLNNFNF